MNDEVLAAFMADPVNASALLQSSFKAFHELMMYHCYRIDWDWQPFHFKIVKKLEQYAFGRNTKQNLVINMPPRFGKTALMESFEAWSFLLNPYSKIIHTSYSDTLIKQSSKNVKNMIMSPAFQKFSNYLPLRQDSQKAEEWKTEPVKGMIGGSYRAATLAGALTGFGFGVSGIDTWGGCCFPYDELVLTESGLIKIGDIVRAEQKIKVYSFNIETSKIELKDVIGWHKKYREDILKIRFNNGMELRCTPDHKIYTDIGYVEATHLTLEDKVFYLKRGRGLLKTTANSIVNTGKEYSYCLTVADNHNFFAGKGQILVSNCTIDDPTKASMNISRADIKACIDLYTGSLKSRANNPKAPFIMIMQRLDPDDLTGYVLENETDEWEQLKIPAYNEQTGESIWEDKMPAYKLEAMKKNSVSVYYGQYQQEPIVVGGEVFKSEWFQYYNPQEYYPYQAIYGVADTAMKKGEANDYTVLSLWGQTYTGTVHLLDMIRGKWDAVELVEVFKATWEKWQHRDIQPYGIYIEDKSSGIGLIQTLKTQTSIPFLPIQRTSYKTDDGILVRADKYSRALAVVPHIAAGRVLLPNNPTDEVSSMLLTEATAFRSDLRAKHDDCVDCLCDAVNIAFSPNFISSVYI